MRGGFALAGGAHADVPRLVPELRQIRRAQITHAALDAADELRQHPVHRAAHFLQRLDAFGRHFARGVRLLMAVARRAAGFHGGETAHAAILLVHLAADLHDIARGFRATRQNAAAHDGVAEGQGLHDVAGLCDATVGDDANFLLRRRAGADVKGGQLGNPHAGHDARGADGAGALADLDGVRTAIREIIHARRAGDIAGDDGQLGKRVAQDPHHVAHALAVAVRGGDGHGIHAAFHQGADVVENARPVEFAEGVARGGDRRAADQPELRVARGLELRLALLRDALDIAHGDEPVQNVMVIQHQQLVDAEVFGEKFVGARDGVLAQFLAGDGADLRAGREGLGNFLGGVARLHHMAGEQAEQLALVIHHREGAEPEFLLVDQAQDIADEHVRRHFDGVLDEALHVVFHAADLGELLPLGHVVMDEAQPAVQRHGDGHARFGHGVHVGGHDGDVEVQAFGQAGVQLRVAGQDFGIKRGQGDVIEREAKLAVGGEKGIGLLIEGVVETGTGFTRCCHVRKCRFRGRFGKQNRRQNRRRPA